MLRRHAGFSLVELMVSMVAGLLLVATVISLFATILRANSTAMKVSRLNQEMQAITDMIARDIERAGYDVCAVIYLVPSGARPSCHSTPPSEASSPFYFDVSTDMNSSCIIVRYDGRDETVPSSANGTVDSSETAIYSYRTDKSIWLVEPYPPVSSPVATLPECISGGNRISTDNTIEITSLTFNLLPSSQASGARAVQLNMSGRYKDNTALTLNLQRDIKLRNDGY
ncbi:PilW family protein [Aeromonas rivipollensis]|uniref:PilW family protein n=1 Tax=Aeromonas rivipollensis TaxID=948519 RepID=UPI0038D17D55